MWERFAHPEWLDAALAAALATGAALGVARAVARRRRRRLVGSSAPPRPRQRQSDLVLLVALVAILVALLGPRFGEREIRLPGNGVDVAILLDLSRSMDARDVPPSRLDRARQVAGEALQRLDPRDRVALAGFGSRGVLFTPLTPDRAALAEVLAALDTEVIHPAGSDLGAGVRAALDAFSEASERPRVVLVLGDGEDPEGRNELASGLLRREGVRVVAVALGTEAGSAIPDAGAELRDRRGEVVVTRRRTGRFERIASDSDGALFLADAWGRIDADALLATLRRDAGGVTGEPVVRRVAAVRVAPFAALAFALLLIEGLPRRAGGRRPGAGLVLVALPLLAASPFDSEAPPTDSGANPIPDPRTLVWVGLDRQERGEAEAAARAFEAAAITAQDPSLAALAYFDLSVTALERGDLVAARDALFDALALAPQDPEARFNLEWTLQALAAAPPEAPEPKRPAPPDGDDGPTSTEREDDATARSDSDDTSDDTPPPPEVELPRPRTAPPDTATRERWMERVDDDLSRALQGAAAPGTADRNAGPVW